MRSNYENCDFFVCVVYTWTLGPMHPMALITPWHHYHTRWLTGSYKPDSGTTSTCPLFSSGGCNRVHSVPNRVFFFSKNTQLETESTRLHPPLEKRTHKMDKEYMISKSVHHFTRKNTRFQKRVHVELDWQQPQGRKTVHCFIISEVQFGGRQES